MKKLILFAFFNLVMVLSIFGQERTLTGTVTDEGGETLPGVTVLIKDTGIGTITDDEGNFSLTFDDTEGTLVFSYVGMETKEVEITEATVYDVVLQPAVIEMDEMVVTALGISRERKTMGYAFQDLDSEAIMESRDPNLFNTLSGQIAGASVTSGGSTVGASSRLVIRGQASFSGNQPLIVVDGTPVSGRTTDLGGGGGVDWGSVIEDIDPNNIESISVLKGPNAAALYGSRATHGAIVIETKSGDIHEGIGVEFTTRTEIDNPHYFPNYQNEYGQGLHGSEYQYQQFLENNPDSDLSYNEYARQYSYNFVDGMGGGVNDGFGRSWGPRLDAGLRLDQFEGENLPWESQPDNWKMDFYQNGINIENNVTLNASGENAYGRVSFSRMDMEGIMYNTDRNRNSLNASLTLEPNERITARANITYNKTQSDNIPRVGYGFPGTTFAWSNGRQWDVAYERDLFDEVGKDNTLTMGGERDNIFYTLHNTRSQERDRIFGNASVEYHALDWLSFQARVGLDYYSESRKQITQSGTWYNRRMGQGGQFSQDKMYNQELNADFFMQFDRTFGDFRLDGIVGSSLENRQYETQGLSADDLTVPDLYTIGVVDGTPGTSMYSSEREIQSVFAEANLSYQDFLFFGVTGRNDWSSTLPSDNRSYFYPSVNLGFTITEAFQIESDILNHAQLRSSWAQVGSDTDPYQLHMTYGTGSFGGVSTFDPSWTLPPVDLRPEITTSYEVGADLVLFDNRVTADITYYQQTTEDLILAVPTSITTGFSTRRFNAGEIENTGVEIHLQANLIRGDVDDSFNWDAGVNWATNTNMVNELYEGLGSYQISAGFGGAGTYGIPGEEWGVIRGLPFVRDEEGRKVVDDRGIPRTTTEAEVLGNINPDWTGGLNNRFSYKKFTLSFLLDFSMGGNIFSTSMWHSYPTGIYENTVDHPKYGKVREEGLIVDGVKEDGTENDVRVSAWDYFGGSWMWNNHEYSILDASYIKLRSVSLGYDVPIQNTLPWINNLHISLYGRNLALLYQHDDTKELGIDPEVGLGGGEGGAGFENFQIPTTRTFGFRMSVNF